MAQAIGPYPSSSSFSGSSDVALRRQLARADKTLAECVACATADTPAGRQRIQELSGRVAQLRESIAIAERNRSADVAATPVPASDSAVVGSPGGRIDVRV